MLMRQWVRELGTDRILVFVGLTPREAVVAAYAESLGDYDTASYAERYNAQVKMGRYGFHLDRFACPFAGRETRS